MTFSNYHTHTTYCDGADTPEELVLEAIRLGCPEIGFSGHSHLTEHEGSMTVQGTLDYCAEIRRLQKQYADRITVRLGIEQDIYSVIDRSLYDYVIGAVHWIEKKTIAARPLSIRSKRCMTATSMPVWKITMRLSPHSGNEPIVT